MKHLETVKSRKGRSVLHRKWIWLRDGKYGKPKSTSWIDIGERHENAETCFSGISVMVSKTKSTKAAKWRALPIYYNNNNSNSNNNNNNHNQQPQQKQPPPPPPPQPQPNTLRIIEYVHNKHTNLICIKSLYPVFDFTNASIFRSHRGSPPLELLRPNFSNWDWGDCWAWWKRCKFITMKTVQFGSDAPWDWNIYRGPRLKFIMTCRYIFHTWSMWAWFHDLGWYYMLDCLQPLQ